MSSLQILLRQVREKTVVDVGKMARLTGIDEDRIQGIEAGNLPTPEELDSYGLAFGVSVEGLLRGEASSSPLATLLFRTNEHAHWGDVEMLTDTDALRMFGDFLRATRELAELECLHGEAAAKELPRPRVYPKDQDPPFGADELAIWLRQELGLGLAPITSMRAILEQLGVPVFFVTPEELDPSVDGASTSVPRPAVLVNLVEGAACWWRTRMTLAHELCHLLVDHRDPQQPRATVSPYAAASRGGKMPRKRFDFYDGFSLVERRAGAFAACFLAPAKAVENAVGGMDPTSEDAIARVGRTFGIGRTAACYRLKHLYGLGDVVHKAMLARGAVDWYNPEPHPDRAPADAGLRTGVLRSRALDAFVSGKIDRVRCYEYLKLRFTEWLPPHKDLTEEQRRPLRRTEDTVRGVAQRYVEHHVDDELVATTVEAGSTDGWKVRIERLDQSVPTGSVTVSYDGEAQGYTPLEG